MGRRACPHTGADVVSTLTQLHSERFPCPRLLDPQAPGHLNAHLPRKPERYPRERQPATGRGESPLLPGALLWCWGSRPGSASALPRASREPCPRACHSGCGRGRPASHHRARPSLNFPGSPGVGSKRIQRTKETHSLSFEEAGSYICPFLNLERKEISARSQSYQHQCDVKILSSVSVSGSFQRTRASEPRQP